MGAPIRSSNEITSIINRGQHSIADLGYELVNSAKLGVDTNDAAYREKVYRLILIRIALQNLLTPDGEIKEFYQDPDNEKAENKVLDVIAKLAKSFDGTSIPFLGQKRIPLYFFPSSSGLSSSGGASGGPASPGGITFQNNSVDAPGEVVDSFNASDSEFALYIYSVRGSNSGEGNRAGLLIVSWRGTDIKIAGDIKTEDTGTGLNTDDVTFSAAINAGLVELTCNVPSDNWVCKGTRILFQNISFQNPLGPLPGGGTTNQLLRKTSNLDYETEWFTFLWQHITDVTTSLVEINKLTGTTWSTAESEFLTGVLTRTINGHVFTGNITISKSDVGLGNADNTSDANKPVSTAQQIAIDAKIEDAIVNGVTDKAPSQNAVFDALALKQDTITGAASTAASSDFTPGRLVQTNASGKFEESTTVVDTSERVTEILIADIMSLQLNTIVAENETKSFTAGVKGSRIYVVQFLGTTPAATNKVNVSTGSPLDTFELIAAAGATTKKNFINTTDLPGIPSEVSNGAVQGAYFYPVGAGATVDVISSSSSHQTVVTYVDLT